MKAAEAAIEYRRDKAKKCECQIKKAITEKSSQNKECTTSEFS